MLAPSLSRRWRASVLTALAPCVASCAFLLDFDELQGGVESGGPDSSMNPQDSGTDGATGTGGTAGVASDASVAGAGSGGITTGGTSGDAAPSDSMPSVDAAPQVPLSELPAALAAAACTVLNRCAGPAVEVFTLAEDCETLLENTFADTYAAAVQASVDDGRITYDPVAAVAVCVQRLVDAAASEPFQCAVVNSIIEECKAALGGLSGPGGPCTHRFECAQALRCDVSTACPGTCVPLAQQGGPCAVDEDCDTTANLFCQLAASPQDGGPVGICMEHAGLNEACSATGARCEIGTYCVNDVCRRVTDVFTTAEGFQCYTTGLMCVEGLSCEFQGLPFLSGGVCVAEKTPLAPCLLALPDSCPDGHYCSANAFNGNGQCVALPGLNQPCASSFLQNIGLASPCAGGFACVAGFCKPRKRVDEACETDAQCYSGACFGPEAGAPVCVPPLCR